MRSQLEELGFKLLELLPRPVSEAGDRDYSVLVKTPAAHFEAYFRRLAEHDASLPPLERSLA